jgi:hypothetical protein
MAISGDKFFPLCPERFIIVDSCLAERVQAVAGRRQADFPYFSETPQVSSDRLRSVPEDDPCRKPLLTLLNCVDLRKI